MGSRGSQGKTGPEGEKGSQGAVGDEGDLGPKGFLGSSGPPGPPVSVKAYLLHLVLFNYVSVCAAAVMSHRETQLRVPCSTEEKVTRPSTLIR